uniref:procollagen-proline 4-dioxygenase n=1 Tax=Saccoglossus kowalevskii TaxID=10224 RepID=A0A1L7H7M7_SACKO|nr:prolyl 4-hydroxylase subunit alpha-1-like protein 359 [Saccoglossus kowalevskii]
MYVVSYLLPLLLFIPHISLHVLFTSIQDLKSSVYIESDMVKALKTYLSGEAVRIDKLKRFLNEVDSIRHSDRLDDSTEDYLDNPINAFYMIRRLHITWEGIIASTLTLENYKDFLSRIRTPIISKKEDFEGALDAILRLQRVYNLTIEDIVVGNIWGNIAYQPLCPQNCRVIGERVLQIGYFNQAQKWLQYVVNLNARNNDNDTYDMDLDESLAYSYFFNGNWVAALEKIQSILNEGDPLRFTRMNQLKHQALMNHQEGKEGIVMNRPWDDPVYHKLCRGQQEIQQPSSDSSSMYCKYTHGGSFVLLLQPYKMEVLRMDPLIALYYDVISDKEIGVIKTLAVPKMATSVTIGKDGIQTPSTDIRVSKGAWLKDEENVVVRRVDKRIEYLTGLSTLEPDHAEQLQVVNYGIGGQYDPHYDFKKDVGEDKNMVDYIHASQNRIATWMFYLSDVDAGGYTAFTAIKTIVKPIKNAAVFWWNLLPSGERDYRTLHAACPVLLGSKWVANKWIHNGGQEFRRPCNLAPDKGDT